MTKGVKLLITALQTNLQKTVNFFGYLQAYFRRNNPVKAIIGQVVSMVKDYLTMNRKLKMAKYRVNYQMYKLNQMEQLIAENNDHVFLRGNKINLQR